MNKADFKLQVFSLSERIYPMVFRMLGNAEDTKDAIQEIMMKLWIKRDKYSQHPNIKAFVLLTARNHCLDLLKKKKPNMVNPDLPLKNIASTIGHEKLSYKELNSTILKIIQKLPNQQREILILRDIDGYKNIEIAFATNLKVEHVRVLLSRARKFVSKELKNVYGYEPR